MTQLKARTVAGWQYGGMGQRPRAPDPEPEEEESATPRSPNIGPYRRPIRRPLPEEISPRFRPDHMVRTVSFPAIDVEKIVWKVETGIFYMTAYCDDLAMSVSKLIFRRPSAYDSLYRALLEGLPRPTTRPDLIVRFNIIATGTITAPGKEKMSFIEVEVPELKRRRFILPSAFTRDCYSKFIHKPSRRH